MSRFVSFKSTNGTNILLNVNHILYVRVIYNFSAKYELHIQFENHFDYFEVDPEVVNKILSDIRGE